MTIPKSVRILNSLPYPANRFSLGTRLHAILTFIRELSSGVSLLDMLQDLADKSYNQVLANPAWQEDAVTAEQIENATAIDAIVNGKYFASLVAADNNVTPDATWNTTATEQKTVTLQVNASGTVSFIASDATLATGDAPAAPRPTSGQCPVGVVHVPASFTAGTTEIAAGGVTFTDGFPRRLAVPTVSLPDGLPDNY